jgi:hypothetical protein
MFLRGMSDQHAQQATGGLDSKSFGYLISIASVFLLGAIAWPQANDPPWHAPVLIAGMALSIAGMGLRFRSYQAEKRQKPGGKSR